MIRFQVLATLMLFLAILAVLPLSAAVVRSMPYQATQPDGSILECFVSGDEYHNWLHDKDSYTIIPDPDTGWYRYAERSGDNIVAGSLTPGRDLPQSRKLSPKINISRSEYLQRRNTMFWTPPAERDAPTTGTINNLVIYIRFSDESEFGQQNSIYDGWFNSSTNSQKNYYLEASYGQLTVDTHFYPAPSGGYVVSWQDSSPRAYYQPYNASTNPIGYDGDTQRRNREFTLLQNACNGVSSQIPSSLTIDSDNDGRVDNVVFVVKGSAGAWSSLLWPHRWSLYDRYVYINGKRVYDFNFQLQTFLASRGVGVICHEFFHTLGAPDLYHYDDGGLNIDPAGSWDIMESDQNPPQHMTAFMKYKYGDWIPSIPTISADAAYTLNPLTSATGQAYRINSNNANQYYVVEFRKKTGTFESSIPGSGMLIYRIDTTCGNGNADGPPDELYIYRPGGTTTTNGTTSQANFSIETGRIRIDNSTNPAPFLQDGSAGNLYLCEIGSSTGTTMSFRKGDPFINFNPNPYAQDFDASYFPPDGWSNPAQVGSYTFTRVTSGGNPSCGPQSGAGMIRYNSDIAPTGSAALMISPRIEVSDISNHKYAFSFHMYRDGNQSAAADRVELYLNSTASLSGSPTLLGTIHRARQLSPSASTPGWKPYSFGLPISAAGSYYVIAKAISAGGYNIFMDSFRIAQVPFPAINPGPADFSTGVHFATNLSWTDGGGNPTGYKLYLGTNNPPTNLVNGTDLGLATSYNHPINLAFGTTYYWQVLPYDAAGSAPECPIWSFSTLDDISVFPLEESFGISGASFPPANWNRYSGVLADPTTLVSNTTYWVQDDWINSPALNNKCARMNIYSSNRFGWLLTPPLNIPSCAMLKFDLALTDYANSNPISNDPNGTTGTDDQFAVLIGDGYSWTTANILRLWNNAGSPYVYNGISHLGETVYLDLSPYQGYKHIAFYGASLSSNADNDLFVDNVSIITAPSSPELHLSIDTWDAGTVVINSGISKLVTISNGGLGNLNIDAVDITGSGDFSFSGLPALPFSLAFGQAVSFSVHFNPLEVGSHNAELNLTGNQGTTSIQLAGFCIDPRIYSLPAIQDFDSVATPNLPLGYTAIVNSTSTAAYVNSSTSNYLSYPNSVAFYNSSDAAADLRLVSPEIMVPMQSLRLKFSARGSADGYTLLIGTMNSPVGEFNLLQSITLTSTHTQYAVSLADYTSAGHYLAFKHGLGGTSRYIYLDDILLEELYGADLMIGDTQSSPFGIVGTPLNSRIQVINNGTQSQAAYTLKLMSTASRTELASLEISTPLAPNASAWHEMSFIPATSEVMGIYADVILAPDGYTDNNSSEPMAAHIYPAATELPFVGDPLSTTTTNYLPLNFYYKNSISETLYLASEIQATGGTINALAFYHRFVQSLPAQPVKVWMKNTTATDLSGGWMDFSDYTLVFDGLLDFHEGIAAILIPFETAFSYTGGNLAIRVNRPIDSVYYASLNHFYYTVDSANPNRSRYLFSDSVTHDPTAPAAAGTLSSFIPFSTFVIGDAYPLLLETPQVSINADDPVVFLSWNSVPGATGYRVYASNDPHVWPDAALYDLNGLSLQFAPDAAREFYKVKAYYQPRSYTGPNFLPLGSPFETTSGEDLLPQSRNKD